MLIRCSLLVSLLLLAAAPAAAQSSLSRTPRILPPDLALAAARPLPANFVVPQARGVMLAAPAGAAVARSVQVTKVAAAVDIVEQVATTTMDIHLRNPAAARLEAELLVPVPDGAVVRSFTFQGAAAEHVAELLPKDRARATYEAIVAQVRDPALLEFAGFRLVRTSVFPVEAGGTQQLRLVYEHVLLADGDRVDYLLPRSQAIDYTVPWEITARIRTKTPVATVYSPSHKITTRRGGPTEVTAQVSGAAGASPGPFLLSYLLQREGVAATLMAYPDPTVGGGYFLLLAGVPDEAPSRRDSPQIPREVTVVLDRSGSMRGEKLIQAREAARQVLAGLDAGEAFNLIVYNEAVDVFSPRPVLKSRATEAAAAAWLDGITARGGTNIHDALIEALRPAPTGGMLPIVLFLTDGLPTIGQTSEVRIREVAAKGNAAQRRVFTFGVGVDVNTPLLEAIAQATRATSTFVLPHQDVEAKVSGVFKRLRGPVLAGPALRASEPGRVRDLLPSRLPDLFLGDQLVLLGQYTGDRPVTFVLDGNYHGQQKTFRMTFALDTATTRNGFVPRLWASRKIGVLAEAIRAAGADTAGPGGLARVAADPRFRELVDEIVRLSTEFGVLTEYTAFLAREGTDLRHHDVVREEAEKAFVERAVRVRSGLGAVSQEMNLGYQSSQMVLNPTNDFYDAEMNPVSVDTVQQVGDRAFYRRGQRWMDSRLVATAAAPEPARVVEFGSDEFLALVRRLVSEGRQASIALRGDIVLLVDGEPVLVRNP